eukprot:gnl/TRDRNA2_/TRDRNA2_37278_c0_seq1.p1 gnl/TRDRNA2_/TRDRNA2_37278_c0~~gnl/TRDRNA2_/TRDRNA2_37278_c0_seq1.p1  ORF type:complete len:190 (+),score=43.35 gnl/TRDRNA2_/TRDRNA2_37278_c0_seq1:104-673(+)
MAPKSRALALCDGKQKGKVKAKAKAAPKRGKIGKTAAAHKSLVKNKEKARKTSAKKKAAAAPKALCDSEPKESRVARPTPSRSSAAADSSIEPAREDRQSGGEIVPVKRGGGRGLKVVQSEGSSTIEKTKQDGTKINACKTAKEQKMYMAKGNAHVETKSVVERKNMKRSADGTVTEVQSKVTRKVSYL